MAAAPIPPIPVARCADRQNPAQAGFSFLGSGASPLARGRSNGRLRGGIETPASYITPGLLSGR